MLNFNKLRPKNFNLESENHFFEVVKFVKKNNGFQKIKKCPICLSDKRKIYLNNYDIDFFKCLKCNLTYSGKHPKKFSDFYGSEVSLNDSIKHDKSRKYRISRFAKERIKILRGFKKKGSLLDIGCGTGWFLEEAKKHYEVMGVEFSDSLRKWLKRNFNIDSSKEIKDIDKKFDIITVFDVIEHVSNPIKFLKNLKKKLKKKGIIFIYTPNFDSLGFSYLKEKNNLLNPHHLFYFNKKSFEYMCSKINLEIIETQHKGIDIGDIYGYMNRKKKYKCANFLKKNQNILQKFVDILDFSNHMRFIIKSR